MRSYYRIFWLSAILLLSMLTGLYGITGSLTGKAFADTQSAASSVTTTDDEEIPWPFGPDPGTGDEEEEEQYNEEEEQPQEEEQGEEEEQAQPEDENPEENSGDEESNSDSGTQENLPVQKESELNPDLYPLNDISENDWAQVDGVKVPFFFLVDDTTPDLFSADEPKIASLKAIKYAGEILNGISFTYHSGSNEVYLANNIAEIPESIFFKGRTDFANVTKFDYEVAIPSKIYSNNVSGRRIVVEAKVPGSSMVDSYELTRTEVFKQAVRSMFIKEKLKNKWEENKTVTGKITAWEVLNDGWLDDEDCFYLYVRVWITFTN
jgi:hypothetical protein